MATVTLRPNGTGTAQHTAVGDTPGWRCVDEVSSDADTTYVSNSNDGLTILTDRYAMEDPATILGGTPAGAITKIEAFMMVRTASVQVTQSARVTIRFNSVNRFGTSQDLTAVTSFTQFSKAWTPVDFAMTWANVISMTCGLESTVQGNGLGTPAEVRCTQIWIIVTYDEAFQPTAASFPIVAQQPQFVSVPSLTVTPTFEITLANETIIAATVESDAMTATVSDDRNVEATVEADSITATVSGDREITATVEIIE